MKRKIGFVGVGNMGKGICHNLILAGNDVSIFDVMADNMKRFEGEAYMCSSAKEVFERSDSGYGIGRYLVKPEYLPQI